MKKSILFVVYGLGIGGVETCLVNLLNALPTNLLDIDLLLMNPEYDMLDRIKNKVNIINSFEYVMNTTDTMEEIRKNGGVVKNFSKFCKYIFFRIVVKLKYRKPWILFNRISKKYDVAISYSKNGKTPYYVIDKVDAKKKVLWNHDGVYEKSLEQYKLDKDYYEKYDQVVSVSEDAMRNICSYFDLENKSILLKNIVDNQFIIEKSLEFIPESYEKNVANLATVGRLVEQKQPLVAIDVCKVLLDKGYKIKWHWIGNGNMYEEVAKKINDCNLQNYFILEGDQRNPYPFIKCADIYVQTSRNEAYSTTITEAKVLCKPIITTDVGGMRDQIINSINGIIVNNSIEELEKAIEELINNRRKRESFIKELEKENWNNQIDSYMEKIFN